MEYRERYARPSEAQWPGIHDATRVNMHREAIAIVGIGCRLPGGIRVPGDLWAALLNGVDATSDVPSDRWHEAYYGGPEPRPGRTRTRRAAFIEGYDRFDNEFFGIPRDQAAQTDPKQRLLLQVAWEALEDGGVVVDRSKPRDFGVFMGLSGNDYSAIQHGHTSSIGSYTAVGGKHYMGANRISHQFNFTGPSVACDAACATGATALALACESIWSGGCAGALVGAANDLHDPATSVSFSQLGTLSPDGRCKPFSAAADGYGRGEAVVVLVIKPVSRAEADGDRIYALIRAVATNHGGGGGDGWAAPNPDAQVALMRQALAVAGIAPEDVDYVEAHGTGTLVGDRIECEAIGEAIGKSRKDAPISIGSVKANFGHAEAAAGLTAVAKVALMLQNRRIVPSIHSEPPNPEIPFQSLGVRVVGREEPLPEDARFAGVNSFGIGGSNAHVVLERYVAPDATKPSPRSNSEASLAVLPFSASSAEALAVRAEQIRQILTSGAVDLSDLSYTLAERRGHHPFRSAIVATNPEEAIEALGRHSRDSPAAPAPRGMRPVFVFPGMGPQFPGMGRDLFTRFPVFRRAVEAFDEAWAPLGRWSLLPEFTDDGPGAIGHDTVVAMVANTAVQIGLVDLWRSMGIEPAAVIGHSVGEVAAAYAAGALDVSAVASVLLARARNLPELRGTGSMAAVSLTMSDLAPLLRGREGLCGVAAYNAPGSLTVSGDTSAIRDLLADIGDRAFTRLLDVDVPFHGPQLRERVERTRASGWTGIQPGFPTIPYASSANGEFFAGPFDDEYWIRNFANPVQFAPAVETLVRAGHSVFVEVGPHPVLRHAIAENLRSLGRDDYLLVASQRRDEPQVRSIFEALAALYAAGTDPDWSSLRQEGASLIGLPPYPWRTPRHWNESRESRDRRLAPTHHLPRPSQVQSDERAGTAHSRRRIYPGLLGWVKDHRVQGETVFPGAGFLEIAASDLVRVRQSPVRLWDVTLHQPLGFEDESPIDIEVRIDIHGQTFEITSAPASDPSSGRLHVSGRWTDAPGPIGSRRDLNEIRSRCGQRLEIQDWYDGAWRRGMEYGVSFRTMKELYQGRDEALARIELDDSLDADHPDHLLHPTLLDGAFQACHPALSPRHRQGIGVPRRLASVGFSGPLPREFWVHTRLVREQGPSAVLTLECLAADGEVVLSIDGLERTLISSDALPADPKDWLFEESWHPLPEDGSDRETTLKGRWLVIGHPNGPGIAVAKYAEDAVVIGVCSSSEPWLTRLEGLSGTFDGLLVCAAHDSDSDLPEYESVTDPCVRYVMALREVLRRELIKADGCVVTVTRGAIPLASGDLPNLIHSGVFAVNRVVTNEFPDLKPVTIDLGKDTSVSDAASSIIAAGLLTDSPHEEYALRDGSWHVCRIEPHSARRADVNAGHTERPLATGLARATFSRDRGIEGVHFVDLAQAPLGERDVRVRVRAAGLNFRDLLKVMGEYPVADDDRDGWLLGDECAGTVEAVGAEAEHLRVGDRVLTKSSGDCLASSITVPAELAFPLPAGMSFADAATIPVAFLTAEFALGRIARLEPGERCLIHSAASGVGLAAVQVAMARGATVFATAGTEEKRSALAGLGISNVYDSRSLDFERRILEDTDGAGVHVVLNSLSGEAIAAGLRCLAALGRFVEIGKRDLARNSHIGLGALSRNCAFHVLDLARLWRERPQECNEVLASIVRDFARGLYCPLPTRIFDASGLSDAFRLMAKGTHMGKIVVTFSEASPPASRPSAQVRRTDRIVRPGSSYLITGGVGGVGHATARLLAEKGARRLVLMTRSDASEGERRRVTSDLERMGVEVVVVSGDVSNLADVERAIERAEEGSAGLRGIVHSAGVLRDSVLTNVEPASLDEVMRPKIQGALNLHRGSLARELDFFVMFSSLAVVNGNAGQTAYIAANRFLDDFAHWRRVQNLPALSIGWGPISDVGMSRDGDLLERFALRGNMAIHSSDAMSLLWWALERDPGQVIVSLTDWTKRSQTALKVPHRLRGLAPLPDRPGRVTAASLRDRIRLGGKTGSDLLLAELRGTVARMRGVSPHLVDTDLSLRDHGVDSLNRMELATWIRFELGIRTNAFVIQPTTTLANLSIQLTDDLRSLA